MIDSDKNGNDIYCIYHLTWSGKEESGGFPLCKERFVGIDEVKKYFEKKLSDPKIVQIEKTVSLHEVAQRAILNCIMIESSEGVR